MNSELVIPLSLQRKIVRAYCNPKVLPNFKDLRVQFGVVAKQVRLTIHKHLSAEERKRHHRLRVSRARSNTNAMRGKFGKLHHNWKGECDDGYGYTTILIARHDRRFVHREVMRKVLGLKEKLPPHLVVHHIDGNTKNNHRNNLAVMTNSGHTRLHALMRAERELYGILKSTKTTATKHKV